MLEHLNQKLMNHFNNKRYIEYYYFLHMLLNNIDSLKQSQHQEFFFKNSKIIIYMNEQTPPPPKKPHRAGTPPILLKSKTRHINLHRKKSHPILKKSLTQKDRSKPVLQPINTSKKKQNINSKEKEVKKTVQTTRASACKNLSTNRNSGVKKMQTCPQASNKNLLSENVLPMETIPKVGRKNRLSHISQASGKSSKNSPDIQPKEFMQNKPLSKRDSFLKNSPRNSLRNSQIKNNLDINSLLIPTCNERRKSQYQDSNLRVESKIEEAQIKSSQEESSRPSEEVKNKMKINEDTLSDSPFLYFQMQRAQVVKYLNHLSCEGKFLFPLLVQRKIVGDKYVDEDFNSNTIQTINGEKVFWSHIAPKTSVKVFPGKFQEALIITPQKKKSLLFTNFLNALSIVQPQVIMRTFQPSLNNIYSIWLFINGRYEPIYIDGDFPFDQNLVPLYGYSQQYLWYSILVKCLSKVLGAFEYQKLYRITPQKLYELLTGIMPKILQTENLKNAPELFNYLEIHKNEGSFLVYDKYRCEIIKETNFKKGKIKLYNPVSKQNRIIDGNQLLLENLSILIAEYQYNWFIYSIQFNRGQLTKFDLQITRKTQFIFRITPFLQDILQKAVISDSWFYIYEVRQSKNGKDRVLNLKHEIQVKQEVKMNLKRGKYQIFLEIGEKKLGKYFNAPPAVHKKSSKRKQVTKNCFTIFSSQQIKVSKGSLLSKSIHGRFVEDAYSMYCPSKQPSAIN